MMKVAGCPLCEGAGGIVIYSGPKFRVIRADEPGFPAFYRVVWLDHVTEFSDLPRGERLECIEAAVQVEAVLREHLSPVKVNLATLGNAVPHLHWHVIARFAWDTHFPGSVWAPAQREAPADAIAAIEALRPALEIELSRRFTSRPGNRA
ncbi:HIT family protein [Ramlibacter sp. WS9]|nr:HIT family protein [Ramlibacter sp. WS9]